MLPVRQDVWDIIYDMGYGIFEILCMIYDIQYAIYDMVWADTIHDIWYTFTI